MLNLQHKVFSLNFYLEMFSSILFFLVRTNQANLLSLISDTTFRYGSQKQPDSLWQVNKLSNMQPTQHGTKQHYTFPCDANKSFNLKRGQFSCFALTLQLPLFRQNSVSGKTCSSLLLLGSAAGQTPVHPLSLLFLFPMQEINAMQHIPLKGEN